MARVSTYLNFPRTTKAAFVFYKAVFGDEFASPIMIRAATGCSTVPARGESGADSSAAVDAFMAELEHPHKAAIGAIRQTILGADRSILEGVKWKSPSFRTTEYFATTHLRAKVGVGVVLHLGAKVRAVPSVSIEDPHGLLEWLAKDRAMVSFAGIEDVRAKQSALQRIIRQWIKHV